ncbi:MAG: 4-hydroxythreonine-4-phosphate dehydrogenase PdxA [Candidatus Latescibacterota bacterium]
MVERPLIGVTVGDPAGIGPEIVVRALDQAETSAAVRAVVFADRIALEQATEALHAQVELHAIRSPAEGYFVPGVIDYVEVPALTGPVPWGRISAEGGRAGFAYLEAAARAALAGEVLGLATAPLNKGSLQAAGVPYIDHTAALAALAGRREPMTLFVVRTLRIFFLTRHIAFRQIPDAITRQGILQALPLCRLYLRQLGIEEPTMAVAGLNPHSGEQGLFGREEVEVIAPAVQEAQARGWPVVGPVPADSVFARCLEGRFDGVLSLYHDQGHIAAKTLDFHGTVSLTMGLEFLRTSVDHGTAFDIAGQGKADARAMQAAIRAAAKYAAVVRQRLDLEVPR